LPREIQQRNLFKEGSEFSYGQIADRVLAEKHGSMRIKSFNFDKQKGRSMPSTRRAHAQERHGDHADLFRDLVHQHTDEPCARLVHVYQDGSVGVSTGGVEMGQGLNTKMVQVAAEVFSIDPSRVKLESTNTTRVANTSPSAASATADLNGKALEIGCNAILERIKEKGIAHAEEQAGGHHHRERAVLNNGKVTDLDWKKLIHACHWDRVNLSESGHYATPNIHFDKTKEKGHPFAYHVYGTAAVMVTVDCLRGTYVSGCREARARLRQAHERPRWTLARSKAALCKASAG
jgi:xanthine dehydrogenase large subunit